MGACSIVRNATIFYASAGAGTRSRTKFLRRFGATGAARTNGRIGGRRESSAKERPMSRPRQTTFTSLALALLCCAPRLTLAQDAVTLTAMDCIEIQQLVNKLNF